MTYDGFAPLIDDSDLPLYGENIARMLPASGFVRGGVLAKALAAELHTLRARHTAFDLKYTGKDAVASYVEWLLDNSYLAQREGLESMRQLRQYSKLPAADGSAAILVLCRALLRSGDGRITPERCRLFLQGCQQVYVLSRRELSCFIPALKAAAVSELSQLYDKEASDEDRLAITAEHLFSTLRTLSTLDFSEFLESVDKTEQIFNADPAGVYPFMSEKTRNAYKRQVEKLAKAYHVSEYRVAEKVLELSQTADLDARHVGYWLFTQPLGEKKAARTGASYITVNLLLTLTFTLLAALWTKSVAVGLIILLPLSELLKSLIDMIVLAVTPPAHVPRMELKDGVPAAGRTICVISALITSAHSGPALARRLEEYRLASRLCGENLLFGLLADLPDAQSPDAPEDEQYLSAAKTAIDALNKKYGGGFFFFSRGRVFNPADKRYMAWERKRGAITELANLLTNRACSLSCLAGNALSLRGVNYILTLDEDTRLTPGAAQEMIGAMLHPLNTPVIDKKTKTIVSGHAILHPRISVELSSCNRSLFSRVFAGHGGTDPYGSDSSELYMDVFGNGGFAGKGIIDAFAFAECAAPRIPENRVLSHDALEGALLRGGFVGDVELTDRFPSDILSYYKRLNRWTRGDWQNFPWLFGRGRCLTDIDRFRLFDSIRRSLVAPATFLAFILAFFIPADSLVFTAGTALFSYVLHLIITGVEQLFRDERESHLRFYSTVVRGVGGALKQAALRLLCLPFEAYCCLIAAVTAVWRMAVSHKGLLNWTPASVLESRARGGMKYVGSLWPTLLSGLMCLIFAPAVIGKIAGILWLCFPFFAQSLSKPLTKSPAISVENRSYLMLCAKQIWSFFEDFCTAEDHFLPPDNFQERPPMGVAHRTSPTNIGLCLLSSLAAIDLGLTRPENALGIIENLLVTILRLPKWNGHLYNWYDTRTLKPLHPAYVSTVDSGNLVACLIILREGLLELDKPALAAYCQELIAPMSFTPLYDRTHNLFSIGMDVGKEKLTDSFYDLMASEARTSGFIAIARGEIPRRHWRSLSRAQVEKNRYRGMVSWTGSMFEYLMPRLFFESAEGSLMYESLRFAVGVQKSRGKSKKLPWGVSESAFYALDSALNYRYKAHGCGELALKRNMNSEYVVSPYSSFLALCCGVDKTVKNLRKLESYGAVGRYGFWEAVDFTEGRVVGAGGETVYCVMAHHLGMSLVAIANALRSNIMPHRLLRDPAISAHACLLDEKLPLGGVLLRRRAERPPEKPPRASAVFWEKQGEGVDFTAPECCLLSNGEYNVMLTNSGSSHASCGELAPYLSTNQLPETSHGIDLMLKRGSDLISLLPAPDCSSSAKFDWEFSFSGARIGAEQGDIRSTVFFSVSASSNGEKRVIALSSTAAESQSGEIVVMLKPLLAPLICYVNHPAFYELGLHAKMLGNALVLKRLRRDGLSETFLCFAASVPMEISVRGEHIPGRGGLSAALDNFTQGPLGWLNNPLICAKLPVVLSPEGETVVTLSLAVGATEHEAYTSANRILASDLSDIADFPAELASGLRMSDQQANDVMGLLNAVRYPAPSSAKSLCPRSALWRFGISGDLPVLVQGAQRDEELEWAQSLIKYHAFLSALSCDFSLVFLTDEGGDYLRPAMTKLCELKRTVGNESCEIHIVDRSADTQALLGCSVTPRKPGHPPENSAYFLPDKKNAPLQALPRYAWLDDDSFIYYVNHSLPPRAWSHLLTNSRFGFIATDCGTGHMWFCNAREYRINRWLCDSLATSGTECALLDGISLFASPNDTDCSVRYGFGFAVWEKQLEGQIMKTSAFVPMDTDARVLIISWDGGAEKVLRWSTDLILSGDDANAGRVRTVFSGDLFTCESPECPFPHAPFKICSNAEISSFTSNRALWLQGKADSQCDTGGFLGITFKGQSPIILVCGCDENEKLLELCRESVSGIALKNTAINWQTAVSGIKIKTPLPALDRLYNGWLPYQTLACRIMGRCSIYQSGGATGFRDQLQDAANLALLEPDYLKAQLIECCRHQYEQGDVMHWWHALEDGDKGVRTRCSDDLIWLPWALCEYVEKTGDSAFCETPVAFLASAPLGQEERDRYEKAVSSENTASVLVHAQQALDLALSRGSGEHALMKIGGGDWNDGMDKIGARGRGESVWLSWFFAHTAHRFSALLTALGNSSDAERYEKAAALQGKAANEAWDGKWFLRGYYDDGTKLGTAEAPCCQIDSIAQSFATLCPEADSARVKQALLSAFDRLLDRKNKLVRLFDPPFENARPSPGYIESYGPGFRENGGQYTHGAIWLVMALLKENCPDEALELIEVLLPEGHDMALYEAEPFVLAADVYSNPDCAGRAGWSWYTGSAGWMFRVISEELLGIRMRGGEITLRPRLPSAWKSCEINLRDKNGGEKTYLLADGRAKEIENTSS